MGERVVLRSQIEAEQGDFVALARELTPEQWASASCCDAWTVHEVVLHIAVHTHRTLRETIRPDNARMAVLRDQPTPGLVELLASPVVGRVAWEMRLQLAELMIHQQDVRRALELERVIPADRLTVVLCSLLTRWVGSLVGVGARKHAGGFRFVATDLDWSTGSGPEVRGQGEAIMMVLAGRDVRVDQLAGDGVAALTTHGAASFSKP